MKPINAWVTRSHDGETYLSYPKGHNVEVLCFPDKFYAVCRSKIDGRFYTVDIDSLSTNEDDVKK